MPKHIYCIADSNQKGKAVPESTGDVHSIPYQDISAVVKDVPFAAYSAVSDREMVIRYLTEHQSVIEGLMKTSMVIPIKFGTIARDEEEIMEILDIGYPRFKNAIEAMYGKIQVEVLALWNNLDEVLKEIGKKEDITRCKEEAALRPSKECAIELGRMVKMALDEETSRKRGEILGDLKGCAPDIRAHDLMDDRMIMNMAFLIERANIHKLYEEIDSVNEKYGGDVNFRVIGPLPPYSFSQMEIKRVDIHEIEEAMDIMRIKKRHILPTENEVWAAYRAMLKACHPDKNQGDHEAQKKFEGIKQAYDTLMDCIQGSAIPSARVVRENVIVVKRVV